jgi:DnaJ domain
MRAEISCMSFFQRADVPAFGVPPPPWAEQEAALKDASKAYAQAKKASKKTCDSAGKLAEKLEKAKIKAANAPDPLAKEAAKAHRYASKKAAAFSSSDEEGEAEPAGAQEDSAETGASFGNPLAGLAIYDSDSDTAVVQGGGGAGGEPAVNQAAKPRREYISSAEWVTHRKAILRAVAAHTNASGVVSWVKVKEALRQGENVPEKMLAGDKLRGWYGRQLEQAAPAAPTDDGETADTSAMLMLADALPVVDAALDDEAVRAVYALAPERVAVVKHWIDSVASASEHSFLLAFPGFTPTQAVALRNEFLSEKSVRHEADSPYVHRLVHAASAGLWGDADAQVMHALDAALPRLDLATASCSDVLAMLSESLGAGVVAPRKALVRARLEQAALAAKPPQRAAVREEESDDDFDASAFKWEEALDGSHAPERAPAPAPAPAKVARRAPIKLTPAQHAAAAAAHATFSGDWKKIKNHMQQSGNNTSDIPDELLAEHDERLAAQARAYLRARRDEQAPGDAPARPAAKRPRPQQPVEDDEDIPRDTMPTFNRAAQSLSPQLEKEIRQIIDEWNGHLLRAGKGDKRIQHAVPQGARKESLKNAYHELAILLHPDRNGGTPAAHDNFTRMGGQYKLMQNNSASFGLPPYLAFGGAKRKAPEEVAENKQVLALKKDILAAITSDRKLSLTQTLNLKKELAPLSTTAEVQTFIAKHEILIAKKGAGRAAAKKSRAGKAAPSAAPEAAAGADEPAAEPYIMSNYKRALATYPNLDRQDLMAGQTIFLYFPEVDEEDETSGTVPDPTSWADQFGLWSPGDVLGSIVRDGKTLHVWSAYEDDANDTGVLELDLTMPRDSEEGFYWFFGTHNAFAMLNAKNRDNWAKREYDFREKPVSYFSAPWNNRAADKVFIHKFLKSPYATHWPDEEWVPYIKSPQQQIKRARGKDDGVDDGLDERVWYTYHTSDDLRNFFAKPGCIYEHFDNICQSLYSFCSLIGRRRDILRDAVLGRDRDDDLLVAAAEISFMKSPLFNRFVKAIEDGDLRREQIDAPHFVQTLSDFRSHLLATPPVPLYNLTKKENGFKFPFFGAGGRHEEESDEDDEDYDEEEESSSDIVSDDEDDSSESLAETFKGEVKAAIEQMVGRGRRRNAGMGQLVVLGHNHDFSAQRMRAVLQQLFDPVFIDTATGEGTRFIPTFQTWVNKHIGKQFSVTTVRTNAKGQEKHTKVTKPVNAELKEFERKLQADVLPELTIAVRIAELAENVSNWAYIVPYTWEDGGFETSERYKNEWTYAFERGRKRLVAGFSIQSVRTAVEDLFAPLMIQLFEHSSEDYDGMFMERMGSSHPCRLLGGGEPRTIREAVALTANLMFSNMVAMFDANAKLNKLCAGMDKNVSIIGRAVFLIAKEPFVDEKHPTSEKLFDKLGEKRGNAAALMPPPGTLAAIEWRAVTAKHADDKEEDDFRPEEEESDDEEEEED